MCCSLNLSQYSFSVEMSFTANVFVLVAFSRTILFTIYTAHTCVHVLLCVTFVSNIEAT